MESKLKIYNTITRKKEKFEPLNPPFVGLYVCGPTVYGDTHLGHARPYITFDVFYRYLQYLGYKVRYVRNITDVGHLVGDGDEGEDKLAKEARLAKLEPMEVAQYYMNSYHRDMALLNTLQPSIEPRATGHIPEQIKMIEKIFEHGYAYEVNGSVYFDVLKYDKQEGYGELSGRKVDDLMAGARELEKQDEKRSSLDFALWKKADSLHIMRWESPWGVGFPGWHLECSVMSTKYLGNEFDIHGGGMDLLFPHHECEIAQSKGSGGKSPVKYWMHNNLITLDGQKMGKSLGNAISLQQFFNGDHKLLEKDYNPMVVRFFILQAHYRSPLDFSNSALQGAEKGYQKLINAYNDLSELKISNSSSVDISGLNEKCEDVMSDDMNTPMLIANLFDGVRIINSVKDGKDQIDKENHKILLKLFQDYVSEILGLIPVENSTGNKLPVDDIMKLLIDIRNEARDNKDFATSDKIRDELSRLKLILKDGKDGTSWEFTE